MKIKARSSNGDMVILSEIIDNLCATNRNSRKSIIWSLNENQPIIDAEKYCQAILLR